MSSLKTQFITHNPFSTCLEIPHYGESRTVRLQALGWGQGLWGVDGSGLGKSEAKVILTQGILPMCPRVSKCVHHTPCNSFQPIFSFDCHTPLILYRNNIFIFTIWTWWVVFLRPTPASPSILFAPPPSFATPAVSQPEQRNVRLDGCSSGNVPFQSAFAPEISSLIPFRPIPAKTGIWWEGNVAGWRWGGVRERNTVSLLRMGHGKRESVKKDIVGRWQTAEKCYEAKMKGSKMSWRGGIG